jgi:membrane peptidoglycan carboxypeptidase
LHAQYARRRLQVCDDRLGSRKRRVRQNAEPASSRFEKDMPAHLPNAFIAIEDRRFRLSAGFW